MRTVSELCGFLPLETSVLERYETLAAKFAAGEASDALKEIFKLKDQGDRNLALRFDLTVPFSRFIAMNPNLKMPFKRYEIGPVFRDGPIKLGRTREFWQMDIDTAGTSSMLADAEILSMVDAVFKELQLDVIIKVNNRKILNGILEQSEIKDKEVVILSIDKLNKIGKEGVTKELLTKGCTQQQIATLFQIIDLNISLEELKNKITNKEGIEGLTELEELFSYLKIMNITTVSFDVTLARGLAYYTGPVFEAYLKKGAITSSLAGGGRYDDLIGNYLGGAKKIPAVGISFGLVPIIQTMKERKELLKKSPTKVYVIPISTLTESLSLVQNLRTNKISADIDLTGKGISKNLDYANSYSIPYVIFLGEDELKKKKYKLKDMNTGEENLLTLTALKKKLKLAVN